MGTRLYFHAADNPNAGTFTGISVGAAATRRSMDFNPGIAQQSIGFTSNATTAVQNPLIISYVSPPLAGDQTIGIGNITVNAADSEANTASNFWANNLNIFVWRPSTGAQVGFSIRSSSGGGATGVGGSEPTGATSEQVSHLTGLSPDSSVSAQDGDVIVFQFQPTFQQSMASSYNNFIYYDGTTENTTENAVVSNHASFVQFTENLVFKPQYTPTSGYPYVVTVTPLQRISAAGTLTIPWPAGHQAGDIAVISMVYENSFVYQGDTSFTYTSPNAGNNYNSRNYYTAYKVATSSSMSDESITFGGSGSAWAFITLVRDGSVVRGEDRTLTSSSNSMTGLPANCLALLHANEYQGSPRAVNNVKAFSLGTKVADAGIASEGWGIAAYEVPGSTLSWSVTRMQSPTAASTITTIIEPVAPGSVGSSAGTSTVSGVGAATKAGAGASVGTTPTSAAIGQSTAAAVGASAGTATVSGAGSQLLTGTGSSAGVATVAGVGIGGKQAVGASAGTSSPTAVGQSTAAAVGASAGTSTSTAVGTGLKPAVGASAGVATVTGASGSGIGAGSSSGTTTVSGVGRSTVNAQGSSTSSSAAAAIGVANSAGAGTVVGNGNVAGVGRSTANAVGGNSAGTATVSGVGQGVTVATGSSTSASATVVGVGKALFTGEGLAEGTSSAAAAGVAAGFFNSVGLAEAFSDALAEGAADTFAVGEASCEALVQAVGRQVGWAKSVHGPKTWTKQENEQ